jgi:hypothetical protein
MLSINRTRIAAAVFAAGMVLASSAAMAQMLVVRSTGPSAGSYPPGRVLPTDKPVVLRANDEVVVLDGKGTKSLRGPGTFQSGAIAVDRVSSRMDAVREVLDARERNAKQARIGAVRTVEPTTPAVVTDAPSLWLVNLAKSTHVCVLDATGVAIWRPDATEALKVMISRQSDGVNAMVEWAAGQQEAAWPASLPIEADEGYLVAFPSGLTRSLSFSVTPAGEGGLEQLVTQMGAAKCEQQVAQVVAQQQ